MSEAPKPSLPNLRGVLFANIDQVSADDNVMHGHLRVGAVTYRVKVYAAGAWRGDARKRRFTVRLEPLDEPSGET